MGKRLSALLLSLVLISATGLGLGLPIGALADATYTTCPTFAQFRHDVESIRSTGTLTFSVSGCALDGHRAIVIKPHRNVTILGNGLSLVGSGDGLRNPSHFPLIRMMDETTLSLDQVTLEFGDYGIRQIWNQHSTITLTNSAIYGNRHDAVAQGTGKLTLTNSNFSFNAGYGVEQAGGTISMSQSSIFNGGGGIWQNGSVTMTDSSIHNNNFNGILESGTGHVTLTNSTISSNAYDGIGFSPDVVLKNSTITGNGYLGIYQNDNSSTLLISSTVTDNGFSGNGFGGISQLGGSSLTLQASLLADNTGGNCHVPSLNDYGYNLSSDDTCALSTTGSQSSVSDSALDLGALGDNGGPTDTIPLLAGSIAVDAIPISNQGCVVGANTDERGITRPQGPRCDIGAFERTEQDKKSTPTTTTPLSTTAATQEGSIILTAIVRIDCGSPPSSCPYVDHGDVTFEVMDSDGHLIGTSVVGTVSGGRASASYVTTGMTPGNYDIKATYHDSSGSLYDSAGTATLEVFSGPPASTPASTLIAHGIYPVVANVEVSTGPSGGAPTGTFSYRDSTIALSHIHLESLVVSGNHATLDGTAQLVDGTPVRFIFFATSLGTHSTIQLRLASGYDSGLLPAVVVIR